MEDNTNTKLDMIGIVLSYFVGFNLISTLITDLIFLFLENNVTLILFQVSLYSFIIGLWTLIIFMFWAVGYQSYGSYTESIVRDIEDAELHENGNIEAHDVNKNKNSTILRKNPFDSNKSE